MIHSTLFQTAPLGGNVLRLMKFGSLVNRVVKLSRPTQFVNSPRRPRLKASRTAAGPKKMNNPRQLFFSPVLGAPPGNVAGVAKTGSPGRFEAKSPSS